MRRSALRVVLLSSIAAFAAFADEATPNRTLSVDAAALSFAAANQNLHLAVEATFPLWGPLRWSLRPQLALGLGEASGLTALGIRGGIRWYPGGGERLTGFWAELHGGGDLVVDPRPPLLFAGRLTGGLGLGYDLLFAGHLQLSPGFELNPFGIGFPNGVLVLRIAIGAAF